MSIEEVPKLVGDLCKTAKRLELLFRRPFPLDGHLVGSIGEVVAAYIYDLDLKDCSTPQIDATTRDGRSVQIKLTGVGSYGFRWSNAGPPKSAEILIALQMVDCMSVVEVYNGLFPKSLLHGRKDSTNGQLSIAASKLKTMNPGLLPQIKSLNAFNKLFTHEVRDLG